MQVFVDDTDPTIQYTGMEAGPLAVLPAQSFFNNTFHHLSAPGSETSVGAGLSFSFSGTEFVIGGTIFLKDQQLFSPQCVNDGALYPLAQHSGHVGILCKGQNLSNGKHTVTVTVAGSKSQSQLWVDFIQYMPSTVTSGVGSLFTPPPNPMSLGSDWSEFQGDPTTFAGVQTNANGAEINFNATGSSIAFLGCPSDNLAQLPPAKVVYTVNGETMETIANNTLILFDTELKDGNNQISVKYGGSSGEMPLTFCGYSVFNTTSTLSTGATPSSHSTSLIQNPSITPSPGIVQGPTHAHSTALSLILGATVAGVALLFLFSFIVQSYRQHRRRRLIKLHSDECGRA
ncbi:hypothetical protein HYPSUDRAFT_59148 [Hypholoma sublateritium FD-334 SS-4]|uniref:Uncharacterized protein n=1 Tax=Hypholoma sublateritium (strain FD-334 SS-4) TaxID=945553 RepID=A0A0D2KJK0_HYPSF|nr:hypothetical protein HYPSUDRAFT_59148 [Hypholoma sublateritium FD-334 SS-4]